VSELADSIKLIRKTLLPQSAALAAVNQLVELVAEMREGIVDVADWAGYANGDANAKAAAEKYITKADALLEGLKHD